MVQFTGGLVSHPAAPKKAYFRALLARQELQGCKPTGLYYYYYYYSGVAGLLGLVLPDEDSRTTLGPWPAPQGFLDCPLSSNSLNHGFFVAHSPPAQVQVCA